MRRIMLLVLLLSFSLAVYGQLYKWVGKYGGTQYSDRSPPAGAVRGEAGYQSKYCAAERQKRECIQKLSRERIRVQEAPCCRGKNRD